MSFFENLKYTAAEFWRIARMQKSRTFMTAFGIIWGTVTVVVLLSFGAGLEGHLEKSMHGLGERIGIMFGRRTTIPYQGFPDGRRIRFRAEDAELLRSQVPGMGLISPEYMSSEKHLHSNGNVEATSVSGVIPEFRLIRNLVPQSGGRFINRLDIAQRRSVIFLGNELADRLFEGADPVGRYVRVGQTPMLVIGVMRAKEQDGNYGRWDKDVAWIPSTTYETVYGDVYLNNIVYKPADPRDGEMVKDGIYRVLARKYRFDPQDRDAFSIWDTAEYDQFLFYFFLGFNLFMGMIGLLNLVIGGIGVANIMYIAVEERKREIGIRMALGARRRNVLAQFFFESLLLTGAGALIGLLLSLLIVGLLRQLPIDEFVGLPVISPFVIIVTGSILTLTGTVAGYFPARRAAHLQPAVCIQMGM